MSRGLQQQVLVIALVALLGLLYGVSVTAHHRRPAAPHGGVSTTTVGAHRATDAAPSADVELAAPTTTTTAAAVVSLIQRSSRHAATVAPPLRTPAGVNGAGWFASIAQQGPDAWGRGFTDCAGHTDPKEWHVRTGWQIVDHLLAKPLPDPTVPASTQVMVPQAQCDGRHPYRLPLVAELPKIVHTHRKPRPKEHTPHDILMRLLHDNVDNATVLVTGALLDAPVGDSTHLEHLCRAMASASPPRGGGGGVRPRGVLQVDDGSSPAESSVGDANPSLSPPMSSKRARTSLRNTFAKELGDAHSVVLSRSADDASRYFVVYPAPLSFSDLPAKYDMTKKFGEWHTHFQPRATPPNEFDFDRAEYPQFAKPPPPAFVAVFRNAVVTDGNVATCHRAYTTGACMWDFKTFGHTSAGSDITPEHRHDRIVALCDFWCNGYFHFTHEHLPRLALVHHMLLADRRTKVTVPRNVGYVKQYLIDVLGLLPEQLLSTSMTYHAKEAIYPQPQRCGSIFTPTLLKLRRIVFERLGGLPHTVCDPPSPITLPPVTAMGGQGEDGRLPLVLWAERKKLSRMPRNYFDIRAEIEANYSGRVRFRDTSTMSVVQQVRAFNEADIVIGPHGANIANAMWMRHGAYLVEFVSYRYANMCYYGTAARLAVQFGAVFHGALKHGHYNSTAEEVARHIEHYIATRPLCARR